MNEVRVTFLEKIRRTNDVYTFKFKPFEQFDFVAGQFLQVILDEENRSNKELNKYLSLSCAPGKDNIDFTKKITDSTFSKKLMSLEPNQEILVKGPMGNCTYKDGAGKIGFLAGGIGITPVISMLEYVSQNNLDVDIHLFYGNWNEESIAFKEELDGWEKTINKLNITHILNETDSAEGKYVKGFITDEVVKEYMPDYKDRMMCIFGPPKMVSTMKDVCTSIGCAKEMIEIENFVGY